MIYVNWFYLQGINNNSCPRPKSLDLTLDRIFASNAGAILELRYFVFYVRIFFLLDRPNYVMGGFTHPDIDVFSQKRNVIRMIRVSVAKYYCIDKFILDRRHVR